LKRVDQRDLVHASATCHVDEIGRLLHTRKSIGIDDLFRFRVQRAGEHDKIGLGKQRLQFREGVHRICGLAARRRIALDANHTQPECFGKLRQTTSDATQTDDQERLAAEFVFALCRNGNHAAPDVLGLIVACLGQLPRHREHERHRVFSDGAEIDPLRAGEPNAALCQLATIELVGPGADRLNEAQALGAVKQLVVPHA